MSANRPTGHRSFGTFLLDYRQPIGLFLAAIMLFMTYWAIHLPIATRFEDLFPANHSNTILYKELRGAYGGAQTLVLMIRVKDGDIFNPKTLHVIQDITDDVNKLNGVNHNEVFSLSSYRVLYARALPGVLESTPFMYPKVPEAPEQIAALKSNVLVHQDQLAGLITPDLKGALVIATFNDYALDYRPLFDGIQAVIQQHENANTTIYASGAVMFAAWGYHYLTRISLIFTASALLMVLLTWLCLGRRPGWWAPVVTGACSSIWGVGFMSFRGYNFDPVMLVIPLVMTARDLAHGIQWQGRYYDALAELDDAIGAAVETADAMLRSGLLAVLACVAGVVFLAAGDIPVLRQLGLGGAVWLGSSLVVVFIGQPILMSYIAVARPRDQRASLRTAHDGWLARLAVTRGLPRIALLGAGAATLIVGLVAYRQVRIGYQTLGTPIYRPDAKVNRDTAEISKFVPANFAWVVLETPEYPSPQSTMGTKTMRMEADLADYLLAKGDAVAVIGFGNLAEKPMNQLLHNGSPKYLALPNSELLSATLWNFFFGSSAPDEPKAYFAFEPSARNACVRILLTDHTAARLTKLRNDLDQFVRERVTPDHDIDQVKLRYLGGEAGLYLAIDDVTARENSRNLTLTLLAIFVVTTLVARSVVAGALLLIVAVMANFVGFAYMNWRVIGLTVDTLPVLSLGVGLGLAYAAYILDAIRAEAARGLALDDTIRAALNGAGRWIASSFVVMVAGLAPWAFSPVLFQTEMSSILILLMTTNVIAALLILPAIIAWLRPGFIVRGTSTGEGAAGATSRAAREALS